MCCRWFFYFVWMASAAVGLKMVIINIHYSFLTAGDHVAFFTYIDFTSTVHWCHWLAIFPGDILCLLCNCGQWWFTCRSERLEFPLFLVSIMSIFIRLGVTDLECLSSLLQVCSASLFFFSLISIDNFNIYNLDLLGLCSE